MLNISFNSSHIKYSTFCSFAKDWSGYSKLKVFLLYKFLMYVYIRFVVCT